MPGRLKTVFFLGWYSSGLALLGLLVSSRSRQRMGSLGVLLARSSRPATQKSSPLSSFSSPLSSSSSSPEEVNCSFHGLDNRLSSAYPYKSVSWTLKCPSDGGPCVQPSAGLSCRTPGTVTLAPERLFDNCILIDGSSGSPCGGLSS